jgi:putative transposase
VTARLPDDRSHATGPNQVWAMDWMYDELFDGKRIWVLTVVDTWSRICPVMGVCRSATAMVVIEALDEARHTFGLPHTIRVDQGCQFTSKELDLWAYTRGITLDFSRPGKPTDLDDAARKVEGWRREYNEVRPHSAIGDRPPMSLIQKPRQSAEASTSPEIGCGHAKGAE